MRHRTASAAAARARSIASRALAAGVGGYLLASAVPVPLVAAWRMDRVDAVLAAMALSFPVYTGAIVWAFAARSATAAWVGIGLALLAAGVAGWALL